MRLRLANLTAVVTLLVAALTAAPAPTPTSAADFTPIWMTIPTIKVNAPVESVGMDSQGLTMDLPSGAGSIAWFNLSAEPGQPGNTIVAGHVDYGRDTAVFWDLNKLQAGDYVNLFTKDGQQFIYQVDSTNWYADDAAPVDQVFGWTDAPTVTIITCGGTFNQSTRNYDKRLVVTAKATWDWQSQLPPTDPSQQPQPTPPADQSQQPSSDQSQQPTSPDAQPTPQSGN